MIPKATKQTDTDQTNVRLFPLSPEAVRRLRQMTEVADDAPFSSCRNEPATTHADDLLRRLQQL
ncbi:MAG: hypothetical protein AAFP85_10665 [Pseudomonadota bacterium]